MILFNDFKSHYDAVRDEIRPAVDRVLESAWYILGEELQAFEQSFSKYIGAAYAVGVASGTDAIALALMAAEIGDGDEVITSNMTAFPTITGITMTGAVPVVVDIDPATGLLDPAAVEAAITPRSRAVVPVHLYGQSCDMDAITALTQAHRISVIEDCAQSVGATCRGKTTGTIGKLGCFSFYPTKNLGAFGEGGFVITQDSDVAQRVGQLRHHGQVSKFEHASIGYNM
ncbi:MAG: DegT/DnrJ/EryC1/StrS family aminotransferase, partial [Lentisphaeria bacterium]|nr:DegT/DnrJ/EryC1/StrS family aminotransferase [Lentisphaeria bacterium]